MASSLIKRCHALALHFMDFSLEVHLTANIIFIQKLKSLLRTDTLLWMILFCVLMVIRHKSRRSFARNILDTGFKSQLFLYTSFIVILLLQLFPLHFIIVWVQLVKYLIMRIIFLAKFPSSHPHKSLRRESTVLHFLDHFLFNLEFVILLPSSSVFMKPFE